jgi:uncharacterized membrane protein (UPF0127 family)
MEIVRIINKTKNTILAQRAEVAATILKGIKGLLGRKGIGEGEGMIIKPCSSIHTFFMQFPIDVIFLNKDNQIAALREYMPPYRMFSTWFKGKQVIELPAGTISKTNTALKDEISIEN